MRPHRGLVTKTRGLKDIQQISADDDDDDDDCYYYCYYYDHHSLSKQYLF